MKWVTVKNIVGVLIGRVRLSKYLKDMRQPEKVISGRRNGSENA